MAFYFFFENILTHFHSVPNTPILQLPYSCWTMALTVLFSHFVVWYLGHFPLRPPLPTLSPQTLLWTYSTYFFSQLFLFVSPWKWLPALSFFKQPTISGLTFPIPIRLFVPSVDWFRTSMSSYTVPQCSWSGSWFEIWNLVVLTPSHRPTPRNHKNCRRWRKCVHFLPTPLECAQSCESSLLSFFAFPSSVTYLWPSNFQPCYCKYNNLASHDTACVVLNSFTVTPFAPSRVCSRCQPYSTTLSPSYSVISTIMGTPFYTQLFSIEPTPPELPFFRFTSIIFDHPSTFFDHSVLPPPPYFEILPCWTAPIAKRPLQTWTVNGASFSSVLPQNLNN